MESTSKLKEVETKATNSEFKDLNIDLLKQKNETIQNTPPSIEDIINFIEEDEYDFINILNPGLNSKDSNELDENFKCQGYDINKVYSNMVRIYN